MSEEDKKLEEEAAIYRNSQVSKLYGRAEDLLVFGAIAQGFVVLMTGVLLAHEKWPTPFILYVLTCFQITALVLFTKSVLARNKAQRI